jgi:peptidoglycan/xylan/chitin deacetylase (PgdA/CDA1 family)
MTVQDAVRRSALWSLSASHLPALLTHHRSGIGSILAFHRICDVDSPGAFGDQSLSVRPTIFHRILNSLRARGYYFASMSEVETRIRAAKPLAPKFVCVTLDDGFVDTFSNAFAVCQALGIPMTVYVATGPMKRTFPMWWLGLEKVIAGNDALEFRWDDNTFHLPARTRAQKRRAYVRVAKLLSNASPQRCLELCEYLEAHYRVSFMPLTNKHALTPRMIQQMHASGLVEFGAHTVSHANLRALEVEEARREMAASRRDLEEVFGQPIRHFAYPYGKPHAAGPREFALCRELGFTTGVTTRMDNLFSRDREHLHSLPRLSFRGEYQDMDLLGLLISGTLPTLVQASRLFATDR